MLHKFIGPQYLDSVVGPEIGSQTRRSHFRIHGAGGVHLARAPSRTRSATARRDSLGAISTRWCSPRRWSSRIPSTTTTSCRIRSRFSIRSCSSIELPPAIVAAINRQTEQFYQIQEYKYRVEREAEESKRKQIEANGIAAFQQTVSQGISDSYLRWRGIEATLALAQSPNSKIVVIGSGKDGLPIILGNVDNPPAPPSARAATGGSAPAGRRPRRPSARQDIGGASGSRRCGRNSPAGGGRSAEAATSYIPLDHLRYRRHPVPHAGKPEPDQIGDR